MPAITNIRELHQNELEDYQLFDVFLGCISYESRCLNVFSKTRRKQSYRIFLDRQDTSAVAQRSRKIASRMSEILKCADDLKEVEAGVFNELACRASTDEVPLAILLDISSMPRPYIAAVLSAICSVADIRPIRLLVTYSLAKYTPPPSSISPNATVSPVHKKFAGWTDDPGKSVAAVVGLGYERHKAMGAVEYLQSSEWWLFLPLSAESKFRTQVNKHNKLLCEATPKDRLFEYDLHSPLKTLVVLETLISSIKKSFKPALLPFGPKIFFFLSLITALVHPEASVWYVSGEADDPKIDRAASGHVIGLEIEFSPQPQPKIS
jgi:hypothetical protein